MVLASYNIHGCRGMDGRVDAARIAKVLRLVDADLWGLQEVSSHTDQTGNIDQLSYLEQELKLTAVAGPTLFRETGRYGNALLTRLPILHRRWIDLSEDRREPRGAIDVDLDVAGRPLRVIVTHLGLRRWERQRQRARLARVLAQEKGPVALLGDLNQLYPSRGRLDRRWPGLTAVGGLRTYPSRFPLFPLDRILLRPAGGVRRVDALKTPLTVMASDHLPLFAVVDVAHMNEQANAR